MKMLQYLEEQFVKFQRLNRILKDNWNDDRAAAFESSALTPILTEWSQYHSTLSDMQHRIDIAKGEIEDDIYELNRLIDNVCHDECTLNDRSVYFVDYKDELGTCAKHMLVDADQVNHMDKEALIIMAYGKFPGADEISEVHLSERIMIR